MNAESIALSIAFILVAIAAIRTLAEAMNLGALDADLPAEFSDVYDADDYAKSQRYTRTETRFGWLARGFDLAVLLLFWAVGGFGWLDGWTRGLDFGPIATGLVYLGLLVSADAVLELPFELYSTFVIEERFGFNKTDFKTFVLDRLKGAALGLLLGVPLLIAILAFFEWAGSWAWLYAWIGAGCFSLVVSFVAPAWILPLFNRFEPLEDGELRTRIFDYAEGVGFPLAHLYVMDGSKRSTKSNAFFTGFGKNRRIALFDTLIEKHSVDELVAVIAHEIGHYKEKHIFTGMLLSIAQMGLLFYLLSLVLESQILFAAFGVQEISVSVGLVIFGIIFAPASFVLSVAMQGLSRKHEFEADHYAVKTAGLGESLVSGLKKLSRDNLGNLTPHPLYVFLTYSHPPVRERILAIRAAAAG